MFVSYRRIVSDNDQVRRSYPKLQVGGSVSGHRSIETRCVASMDQWSVEKKESRNIYISMNTQQKGKKWYR